MSKLIPLLLLSFSFLLLPAQEKKVGLVLSGGGASGLAHVGVLKALEENEIEVDYIVGTSIGALVGGFYASGYSPAEIEAIVNSQEFKNAAEGLVDEDRLFYLKQAKISPGMISFRFDLDSLFETNIPNNFISSNPIDLGLMGYFAQTNQGKNESFDSLMIPFRCLAANITTKTQKVFREGQLASAIRASMTYPFYIAPITIEGGVMLDGGLYNNFPVDVLCREFEVDYIIASNVSARLESPSEDNLVSQVRNILIRESNYQLECADGLIIQSEVDDIGTFNFNQNKKIIERGYQSTLEMVDSIKKDLGGTDEFNIDENRKAYNKSKPALIFDEIHINGLQPIHQKYLRKHAKGKDGIFDYRDFEASYLRLASDEKIKALYPTAVYNPKDSLYEIYLKAKKEKHFKATFGGVISSKPFSTGFFELNYQNLGSTGLKFSGNIFFGNFYSSTEARIRWDVPFTVPFYLEANYTVNQYDYFNSRTTFIEDEDPPYIISSENYVEGKIGLPLTNKAKIIMGGSYNWQNFNYYQSDQFERGDTSDLTKFEGYSTYFRFEINSLNHKLYASKGTKVGIMIRNIYGEEHTTPGSTALDKEPLKANRNWWVARGSYEDYFLERNSFRFGLLIEGVYSNHPFFQNYTATTLSIPVFEPLPENKTLFQEEYRALSYLGAGLKTIYTINDKLDFRLEAYAFQPYQAIRRDDDGSAKLGEEVIERSFIGTFTTVYHSRLGPLALSFNYFDDTDQELSILLHFGYILFNRKGFE